MIKKCKGCEIILHNNLEGNINSLESEKRINHCVGCEEWEENIKNKCFICKISFKNSEFYFKRNGNYCLNCMKKIHDNNIKKNKFTGNIKRKQWILKK